MTKFFVYIADTHGLPMPQIWHNSITDGNGKAKPTLFMKELDAQEEMLSVSSLAAKYPYEAKS